MNIASELSEAYLLNGQYDKALQLLASLHRADPDLTPYQHDILRALRALGRDNDDLEWVQPPEILTVNPDLIDRCYQFLKPLRKPRSIWELTSSIGGEAYQDFTDDELLQALVVDERFVVVCDELSEAKISVARKRKRTTITDDTTKMN